ncbi:phosphoribosylformylglycinamidine synthase I [candidate division WOR-3 bacterium 4484_100]|uniref:Phosphoribosylformylglycinamidine synthase subunit PurQ n=1 Tax=candidate division WOR-3 bacterium 4484_100 TaxID=1936077 RepID=A0A1V4QF53_UNCW3|nr:MAG: phosphoribosylformylglycinamidine synthase I [candidate division WOR-3 bacterium 4484_100]
MKPKVLVLRAAGTNCDVETAYAFELAGAEAERVYIDELIKKDILKYQIIALPGGFTYGDDIAAGKILANEIKYKLQDKFLKFIEQDRLIIGICNGFQVLVKAGILPGFDGYFEKQSVSLITNDSERFEDRWVYLKVHSDRSVFTRGIKSLITLPVAHAEGKFVTHNGILDRIKENIVFQYVDAEARLAGYPFNPNGSVMNIAGITDPTGRILGLMPHPERFISPLQHPAHTREELSDIGDGLLIFKNGVEYFK